MAKPCLLLVPLLLLACGSSADPPAKAPLSARPADTARFSGAGYGGPTQLMSFPAEHSRAAREASRRAREDALLPDDEVFELHRCTADWSLCARVVREGERHHLDIVERVSASGGERRFRFTPAPPGAGDRIWYHVWPKVIRERGGAVMVGLLAVRRAGGGGSGALTTWLSLIRLAPGADAALAVLAVPVDGGATARACYSEQDMRLRRQSCTDDFEFTGTLELGPPRYGEGDHAEHGGGAGTAPDLIFTTHARTFPGRAFRLTDAEAAARDRRQFARSDLVWADDPLCSYRRTFTFDPAAAHYVPDAPLPDCGDYLISDDDPDSPAAR